jgi:hypothetical protein
MQQQRILQNKAIVGRGWNILHYSHAGDGDAKIFLKMKEGEVDRQPCGVGCQGGPKIHPKCNLFLNKD